MIYFIILLILLINTITKVNKQPNYKQKYTQQIMILNRLSLFKFATKKVGEPGIILEPDSFCKTGLFPKALHWFRNLQTYNDMERHMKDFNRSKSHSTFLHQSNKLLQLVEKRNFTEIEPMVKEDYFKVILS